MKRVAWIVIGWVWCAQAVNVEQLLPFCSSFLDGVSFGPESRFVNEYHRTLLDETKKSFVALENYLQAQGFNLAHRYTILGYEQHALPVYFDCLSQKHLDDEVVLKTDSGWEFTPGNVSGFLTGYLFKDAERAKDRVVEHIAADQVELFTTDTEVLQRHAFGDWYDTVAAYQQDVQNKLYAHDVNGALRSVTDFWRAIYESRHKVGGYCATQDLLFSLYYVDYLLHSPLAMRKLFVGPDITYPIEVVDRQDAEVTRNAQTFVHHFVKQLVPVNNQKTAYIFCSFVDGVGKSTLLGNVRNLITYKDNVAAYQHVSNASSQTATLYTLNDQVVIVDLPAQISHHCAKPDGSVYVDLGFCSALTVTEKHAVMAYVAKNRRELLKSADERLEQLAAGQTPTDQKDQLLSLIKQLDNNSVWCPCTFEGRDYVFNRRDARQIRVLVPFDGVHSQGLKIKEPELMVFDKGLAIPMRYDAFLSDLAQQMRTAGVQQVVFVDFASLYPRTSRETVRVNYIIQLLKKFYGDDYSFMQSAYRPFAHRHEVYPLFFDHRDAFERTVGLETLLRFVIHDVVGTASREGLTFLSTDEMQRRLREHITELFTHHKTEVDTVLQAVRARIEQDMPLVAHYQLSKFYEAVSRFSVERLAHLGAMVLQLVYQSHPDEQVRHLFGQLGDEIESFSSNRRIVTLHSGLQLEVMRRINQHEIDQALLEELVPMLRKLWYEQVLGIMIKELHDSYRCVCVIKKDRQGDWYLLRAGTPQMYGLIPEVLSFDTEQAGAAYEADAESCDEEKKIVPYIPKVVARIRKRDFATFKGCAYDLFVPTSIVCNELDLAQTWHKAQDQRSLRAGIDPFCVDQVSAELLQTIIRALATIHWILKSPYDEIMVRYGNRDDFVGAVRLLEDVIFTKYMTVPIKERIFDDYTTLMPLVGEFEQK